jgi:segregation and condensation protein A
MDLGIASHQTRAYTVTTPLYQGPLDLLLQLIERAELDITRLSLAQVTDQFLEYLQRIQDRAAEEVSAFLVIAAKLLQIKSEALLPRPPVREAGEEDPGEALARQLIAYKRFKEIAEFLWQHEEAGLHTYLRLAPPPKVESALDLSEVSLQDILNAALSVFYLLDDRPSLSTVVTAPRVTIREKISLIARLLRIDNKTTFRGLLNEGPSNLDVVVTFLAMLELIKRRLIRVNQTALFGEIELERAEVWDENESFELEFGE